MTNPDLNSTTPQLTSAQITISEAIPQDLDFLDTYQENTWNQIRWDDNKRTIKGKQPVAYMVAGIKEEVFELIEPDKVEPGYSRVGALFHDLESVTGTSVSAGEVTATAVERHTKEFGDVSWYLSNLMHLIGMPLRNLVQVGLIARQLDIASNPRMTPDFYDELEKHMPGALLMGAASELSTTATRLLDVPSRDGRLHLEKAVVVAGGKFLVAATLISASRFGSSYEAFLDANKAKLAKRIADGTVFDKSGGDDR